VREHEPLQHPGQARRKLLHTGGDPPAVAGWLAGWHGWLEGLRQQEQ
jgi:hypothetical protein